MCHRPATDHSQNLYLGLHLGVERFEAILIDADLQVRFTTVVRYDVDLPEYDTVLGVSRNAEPDEFLVSPVMYVKALDMLLNSLATLGADLHKVVAVAGAAHHYGTVFWSEMGFRRLCGLNSLSRLHEQLNEAAFVPVASPSWVVRSAIRQCYEMEEDVGGSMTMVKVTGSKCFGRLAGPQIRKLNEESPAEYERTVRISLMSSFLSSMLVGSIGSIDYSDGSGMNLLDIGRKTWSKSCLGACAPDLKARLMNPIASNRLQGRIADYFVDRWQFRPDCMVVSATGSSASMLSGLNLPENVLVLLLSTSDKLLMSFEERPQLDDGFVMCHPTNADGYIGLILFRNGSAVRESVCDQLANGDWTQFNEMLSATPMGNNGNIEVRLDEMEYTPEAKGTLRWDAHIDEMSMEALHGRQQFEDLQTEARAVIEGQIMHRCVVALDAGFKIQKDTKIIALGKSSRNPQILQIVADVFNAPVYTHDDPQITLLGAAYRARYAFYEYREANCNCQSCRIRRGRQPKLSYAQFFRHLPDKLRLAAVPTKGCEVIYSPLIDRCRNMCRVLAAGTNIDESRFRYE
ncbi:hypothetical protein ACLKA7_004800 [Drosophila subpalustris]